MQLNGHLQHCPGMHLHACTSQLGFAIDKFAHPALASWPFARQLPASMSCAGQNFCFVHAVGLSTKHSGMCCVGTISLHMCSAFIPAGMPQSVLRSICLVTCAHSDMQALATQSIHDFMSFAIITLHEMLHMSGLLISKALWMLRQITSRSRGSKKWAGKG